MRILAIETNYEQASWISSVLLSNGFEVFATTEGDVALAEMNNHRYDFIVMNEDVEDMNGLQLLRLIRTRNADVPIVMIASCLNSANASGAILSGADDFIQRPVRIDELVARIRAVARRAVLGHKGSFQHHDIFLSLDPSSFVVEIDGKSVSLSEIEYRVFDYLLERRGQVVMTDELALFLYGDYDDTIYMMVDLIVLKLKSVLENSLKDMLTIRNILQIGFILEPGSAEVELQACSPVAGAQLAIV